MPVKTTDVQQAAREHRAALLRRETAARKQMAREWAVVRRNIGERAQNLLRHIEAQGGATPNQLYRLARFQDFSSYAEAQMTAYSARQYRVAVDLTDFAARFGYGSMADALAGEATALGEILTMPNERAVEYLTGRVRYGKAAEKFITTPREAAGAVTDALVGGLGSGAHPYVVAAAIQRAADVTAYSAQRIARTEMLTAYRAANLDAMRASGVVTMWRWEASLDDRCCAICWTMHGTLTPVGDTFDTHINCRCSPTPVTMSYGEMLREYGIDSTGVGFPQDPDFATGPEVFANLDADRQRAILGPSRLALREDGLPLSDMVQRTYDPVWGGGRELIRVRDLMDEVDP